VVGLGHTNDPTQQMYPSAVNTYNGVYQAGDLNGLRHVGLSTGCLRTFHGHGRTLPGYVPESLPMLKAKSPHSSVRNGFKYPKIYPRI